MPAARRSPNSERQRHEEVLRHFEDAWRGGRQPVLEEYLPADPAERSGLLVELVHLDLEYRIKAGERVTLGFYTERFPELKRDPEVLAGMRAAAEAMRKQAGITLGPATSETDDSTDDSEGEVTPPPAPEVTAPPPAPSVPSLPQVQLPDWRPETERLLRRKLRRYRALVATLAALLLAAGVFLWLLMAEHDQMRRERDEARQQIQQSR